ncbi:hypothetical protein ES703_107495 [subsurface metagenome]
MLNMRSGQIKGTIVALVFVWFTGSIFNGGCATDHGGFMMSKDMKVCIIDLKNDTEYQELLGGEPQTCGMRSGRVYLQPGETCGQHNTNQYEEMLVFLSGRGLALIDENHSYEVGEGKVSYIPPHTTHNIKNTGSEPLIYIYCVAPVNAPSGEQESGQLMR